MLDTNLQQCISFMHRYLLTSATLVQTSTDAVIDYVRIMLLTVRKLSSLPLEQETELSFFSHILLLFQLMIRALYGNERLSKIKLQNERGFAIKIEEVDIDFTLNLFGLCSRLNQLGYLKSIIVGERNSNFIALAYSALFLDLYLNLSDGAALGDFRCKLMSYVFQTVMKCFEGVAEQVALSDGETAVSFLDILSLAMKKHQRNPIIKTSLQCLLEILRKHYEEYLFIFRGKTFSIRLYYGRKVFLCNSATAENGIQKIKKWLKSLLIEEVRDDWSYMYVASIETGDESRLVLVKAVLDEILAEVVEYFQKESYIDLEIYIRDSDMFSRLFCSEYPLFHDQKLVKNFKVWELIPTIQALKQYFIVVIAYILYNGSIPKCVTKIRESVTKSLPYKITCSQIIFSTGLFSSNSRVKHSPLIPQRCDFRGN